MFALLVEKQIDTAAFERTAKQLFAVEQSLNTKEWA